MSITITIVTTANRTRRFTQSDPARVSEVLDSLKRCAQIFSNRTLVVVSESGTEVFCPAAITRIEFESDADLSAYLPHSSHTDLRALALGETPPTAQVNELYIATPIDFYFEGGDSLSVWAEGNRPNDAMERTMRITRLFEQPIIFYRPVNPGIGFINPSVLTRAAIGVVLNDAPTGTWHVKNA